MADTENERAQSYQRTAPERIYLNIFDDLAHDPVFPADHEGITWCEDDVGDCDVPYVRRDVAAVQRADAYADGYAAAKSEAQADVDALSKKMSEQWAECTNETLTAYEQLRSAQADVRELVEALRNLLEDTQHSEHHCGDSDCPVAVAEALVAKHKGAHGV